MRRDRPDNETLREARRRRYLESKARDEWRAFVSELCDQCNQVRTHVNHEPDPATSIEGPEYYADFLDELHEFEPSGRWT